uniref:Retrotransposable element Tf2 n=1 Tax=Cajanus cajan TaxID=3821 RepID=A0A151RHH2_CAJCA|nr:Retrotransposable element Tf2 [Cajanus cajan]
MNKTLKRLSANFYWSNMAKDVRSFISQCRVCQQTKYSTKRLGGLLVPLPIPSHVWEDISMDFITGLPLSLGYTVIFVVVDRFSKGVHLGALPSSFTAYKVAELFVSMFCKHHGLPKSIVSDRDLIFMSRFWSDLFKFSGTLLRMSSSYHPQSDGQTEVMNRTIEQYLRAFVHETPQHWFKFLPWAEFHYNTSVHSGSKLPPFQIIFGKPPPSIPEHLAGTSQVAGCDSLLSSREDVLSLLR